MKNKVGPRIEPWGTSVLVQKSLSFYDLTESIEKFVQKYHTLLNAFKMSTQEALDSPDLCKP